MAMNENDFQAVTFIGFIWTIVVIGLTAWATTWATVYEMRTQAVKHNCGHYNTQTADFIWGKDETKND